nr:MAG TPA: hypothetical protein [Caudoviricetes sp.]
MKKPISLKTEREVLIAVIKDLVDVNHRLSDFTEGGSEVALLYGSELLDADMKISNLCSSLGNMIGYTVYSDICEGLDVKS